MSQQRILYVEDDALVAFPVEMMLAESGYEVVAVSTAAAAITELQSGREWDLLLTDIRLPNEMDGWAIARRARELFPDLPVIYVSGDSAEDWNDNGVPESAMLAKPFSFAMALTVVSRALS